MHREPTAFLSKKLWRFSEHRGLIVLFVALSVGANLSSLLQPMIFGVIVATIGKEGINSTSLPHISFLLALFPLQIFLFWLLHGPSRVIERVVAYWAEIKYRKFLIDGVLDLGLSWHSEHDSGDTIDKINKASEGLGQFGQNVFQVLHIVVKVLGTTAVLMWFSFWLGLAVFGLVVLSLLALFQFDRRLLPQYRRLNEFANKASAAIFDAVSNVTTIKILHIEKPVLEGVIKQFKASRKVFRTNVEVNEWKWFAGNMCFESIKVGPLIIFLYLAIRYDLAVDAGVVSALYLYLEQLASAWFTFGSVYEQIMQYKNRVQNAEPIENAIAQRSVVQRKSIGDWKQLTVQDLNFGYDDGVERLHLDHIEFSLRRGERIAVIGESGSGKTTFLKVLHGMYPNAKAIFQADDEARLRTNFVDIDLKTMLVPQEPELFSSTIRENMTLGREYSEESLKEASHIAAFDKVVADLPKGLESIINEKGVNLSGGQKQRLALARAILYSAEKDIILLDESTSSVDSENETEIYHRIFGAFSDKTIIAAIHKMNLLKLFDRIVMFESGRIADHGTFEELLRNNAAFHKAWKQFVREA